MRKRILRELSPCEFHEYLLIKRYFSPTTGKISFPENPNSNASKVRLYVIRYSKFYKATYTVNKYYAFQLKIHRMYTMINEQKREFDHLSDMKNEVASLRSSLLSKIKVIEHDVAEIGKRIIETNILVDQYDGHNELIKER